jgi:molybdate transport system ATP-binding protein
VSERAQWARARWARGSLQVADLWIELGEFHLRQIGLDIAPGEYFVVLGPTGAGKTVLLETIAGLYRPERGRILADGEEITDVPPERRGIGFVYQDYVLFPHLSVEENVAFGLHMQRQESEVIRKRVTEISELLGIDHLLHRRPDTLSGGEKQRAALARALVVEPRLLLLDEPLSALDPETREGLQRELARLHRELGTTTLHVTHDFEEAIALGDRIAVLNEGQVVQVGPPEEIFRKPTSEFVARFVGVRNIFQGEIHRLEDGGKALDLDGLEIAVVTKLDGKVHGSIRPEDILLSREPLHSSARNAFRSRIVNIVDKGILVYVTVRVLLDADPGRSPEFTCVITRTSAEEMKLREEMDVHIVFKASAVHVF